MPLDTSHREISADVPGKERQGGEKARENGEEKKENRKRKVENRKWEKKKL